MKNLNTTSKILLAVFVAIAIGVVLRQAIADAAQKNTTTYPLHSAVVTTVFWVGEDASEDNKYISNQSSAWDENWQTHYGGYDDPYNRNGYQPANFTPNENPFYVALPYNDIAEGGSRKASAKTCPNFSTKLSLRNYSWCKNSWVEITYKNKTAYAQWEDSGPYLENDYPYVFGSKTPSNRTKPRAGLDVSPAVRDYLGLPDVSKTNWRFVGTGRVPTGPWKNIQTTSLGDSLQ